MSQRNKLARRAFLRGAGTVVIALPFLEEFARGRAHSDTHDPPERLVTLFFGLGLDPAWQGDFSGPLEPLAPFSSKLATFSVDHPTGPGGAHCETSAAVFVGEEPTAVNVAGGPSIDQWVKRELDPGGATLASGLWWRRGACPAQALRVFGPDGSGRPPVKRPSEVFDQVFGSATPPMPTDPTDPTDPEPTDPTDPALSRHRRIRRSILDTVIGQYQHLRGDRSPLGYQSKLKVEQHLSSIREIERQLAPADTVIDMGGGGEMPGGGETPTTACVGFPERPIDPVLEGGGETWDYDEFTYGTGDGAPVLRWEDAQSVFRLHADLWAVALRCDLLRFGNLMHESAGGHMNLEGTYSAMGESTDFPGSSQHDSYFHGNDRPRARLYQHWAMTNLGYFLRQLDDDAYLEANGRTVLDNTTVVIGTEYGWNHDANNAFHAVLGNVDRFRAGVFTDQRFSAADLYNAVLRGHGIDASIGARTGVPSHGDAGAVLLR